MSGQYLATVRDQADPKDAADVARREAESHGLRVLEHVRTFRGSLVGTWVVELRVEKKR